MAPSRRPLKKPRLGRASLTQLHEDTDPSRQLCLLLHRLALLGISRTYDEEFERVMTEIVSVLRGFKGVHRSTARKLHGMLLLNIGYSIPLNTDKTMLRPLSIVTSCLLSLYRYKYIEGYCESNNKSRTLCMTIEPEESEEAYTLVLQVMKELSIASISLSDILSDSIDNCLQLIELILVQNARLRQTLDQNRHRLESILHCVFLVPSEQLRRNERRLKEGSKGRLLSVIENISCTTARLTKIAEFAFSGSEDKTGIKGYCTSVDDLVFYLNCVSQVFSSPHSQRAMYFEKLVSLVEDNPSIGGHSKVVECLCQMIHKWGIGKNYNLVLQPVLDSILRNLSSNETLLRSSVRCIRTITRRPEVCKLLTKLRGLDGVLNLLVEVATGQSVETDLAVEATDTVLAIASTSRLSQWNEEIETTPFKPVEILSYLIEAESELVVGKAVNFLEKNCKEEWQQKTETFHYPNLIDALAQASLNEFVPLETRDQVIEIFRAIAEKDAEACNLFVREGKILESLVRAASDHRTRNSREAAIFIIIALSNNACNRRILAKHPGLLSSLIRYTRKVSRIDEVQARNCLKKHIFLIAKAL